jgi:hypothetical protein
MKNVVGGGGLALCCPIFFEMNELSPENVDGIGDWHSLYLTRFFVSR